MKIVGVHLEPGPVGWLRCWNWTTALERRGHQVKHRPHAGTQFEWSEVDDYLKGADVVIAGRMHHGQVFAALLAGRKLYGYKLVVDTDDNFDKTPLYNQSFSDYHSSAGVARICRAELREADLVTVSTPPLKEFAEQYAGRVVVMPNCVDTSLYEKVRSREKEPRHRGDLRIYWGGGGGHYDDLLKVRDPLLRIFAERPNVKLIFSNILPDWAVDLPSNRVFFIRFAHMNAYCRILRWLCADVALAPLVDNEFNRCKSNIKYLDYGMAEIPGVYSDVEPYSCVQPGITGLKARTDEDWYDAINRLLESATLRRNIAREAKADILENWTIDSHIGRYEAMLKELVDFKVPEFQYLEEGVTCQTQS
jgi:processive 1,2-diacylglycerol beta-glucosyltransferase